MVDKCEGKKPFGRHRHRQQGNIKVDLKAVSYEGVDWVDLTQERIYWLAGAYTTVKTVEFRRINFCSCTC
jgi:hypothetical protein